MLSRVPSFIGRLADLLELPRADAYEVRTQVGQGCIIDLEIQAHTSDGEPCWLLWSEHKVADPLTVEQLVNEAHALEFRARELRRKLIAVTLYPPSAAVRAHAEAGGVTLLRWTDLVGTAQQATYDIADAAQGSARGSGAHREIERRLLLEWCAFCENELEASVEPLTEHRIGILPDAELAFETLEHLLEVGFRYAIEARGAGALRHVGDELHAAAPAGMWLADLGCKLYARYDVDDSWTVGGSGRPALIMGMWADGEDAPPLRERIELRQTLRENAFSCWDEPGTHGWIAFAKPLPLAALLTSGDLEGQERAVRAFCARVLDELLAVEES